MLMDKMGSQCIPYEMLIGKCDLIGDIEISEDQYKELVEGTRKELQQAFASWSHAILNKYLVALTLVQIGIRECKTRNYWDEVYDTLGVGKEKQTPAYNILSDTFFSVTKAASLFFYEKNNRRDYRLSILAHGIAPDIYIKRFFEFLWDFYLDDLCETYTRNDPTINILLKYFELMQRNDSFSEDSISIGGKKYILVASLKILLSNCPDTMRKKISLILGWMDEANWNRRLPEPVDRLSTLFCEWHESIQTSTITATGHIRKNRDMVSESQHISIKYKFSAKDRSLYIYMPSIRLSSDYNEEPILRLWNGTNLIKQQHLKTYGRLLKIIDMELFRVESFMEHLRVEIVSGNEVIYDSKNRLSRQGLLFNLSGDEETTVNYEDGCYHLVTSNNANVAFEMCDNELFVLKGFDVYTVNYAPESRIYVNGTIFKGKESNTNAKLFLLPSPSQSAVYRESNMEVRIFGQIKLLTVMFDSTINILDIKLVIDDRPYRLCDMLLKKLARTTEVQNGYEVSIEINNFLSRNKRIHQITCTQLTAQKILDELLFLHLKDFRYSFDKPWYYNEEGPAKITAAWDGKETTYEFNIGGKSNSFLIPLEDGDIFIPIPVIRWRFESSEWYAAPQKDEIWYEDIRSAEHLIVESPGNVSVSLRVGKHYEILGYKDKKGRSQIFNLGEGLTTFKENVECKLEFAFNFNNDLTILQPFLSIAFKPYIENPRIWYFKAAMTLFWWWRYVGPKKELNMIIKTKSENEVANLMVPAESFGKQIMLEEGFYTVETWIEQQDDFGFSSSKTILFKSELVVGDANELKFKNKTVEIKNVVVDDKVYLVRNFFIEKLRYKCEHDCYFGIAFFRSTGGEKIIMAGANPVRIRFTEEQEKIYISDKDNDGFLFDQKRQFICNATESNLSSAEIKERYLVPDYYIIDI